MEKSGKSVMTGILILLLCVFFSGCGSEENVLYPVDTEVSESTEASEETAEAEERSEQTIYVYLCGAVQNPGVYEVPEGTRLFEVLRLAGGMRADASDSSLNQAEKLTDGQQIRVPTQDEAESTPGDTIPEDKADPRVNINTADEAELTTISGIGASRARAIIAWREEHGSFQTIEDIKNVTGIKEGLFSRIRDSIRVS
ncbi:competence protein ComEA [Lachnospiraceae bacterium]|nr:competence protein ComEA [Lachnospiraceae bacterium]